MRLNLNLSCTQGPVPALEAKQINVSRPLPDAASISTTRSSCLASLVSLDQRAYGQFRIAAASVKIDPRRCWVACSTRCCPPEFVPPGHQASVKGAKPQM